MLHISKISLVCERKDGAGVPVPFSFKAVTLDGRIIDGSACVITSSNHARRTVNVKYLDSGEIRTIRLISFIDINGQEVVI
jgi:hypothetical protein